MPRQDDDADIYAPKRGRGPVGCWVVAIGFAVVIAVAVGVSAAHSGGSAHSDPLWASMSDQLHGHVNALTDAVRAGNNQGALDANTKIAKDCREAGGYPQGASHDEQVVRNACSIAGFPVP